jgi:hypothetical protein
MPDFQLDLTGHEMTRRHAIIEASQDWDPISAFTAEADAQTLLYSGLDANQQATFDELVSAGVLPEGLQ